MKKKIVAGTLALMTSCTLYAETNITPMQDGINGARNYDVGLRAGTLGAGVDISTPINENLTVRVNINGFNYSRTEEIDDINYNGDLKLFTAGVLLDYFPFASTFRVSAGAYYNNNKFTGTAKPVGDIKISINDIEYGVDDVGQLDAKITFNKFAPYLGFGWGSNANKRGFGFSFDIGAIYHGTPKTDLNVIINNKDLEDKINQDVEAEKRSLEDEIDKYKFYPVVMIGVNYTF